MYICCIFINPRKLRLHLSIGDIEHDSAGTLHPSCAIIAIKHVCLNRVDFPPIFGPLNSKTFGRYSFVCTSEDVMDVFETPPSVRSLGIYSVPSPLLIEIHMMSLLRNKLSFKHLIIMWKIITVYNTIQFI